jgi:hypothetical protein
MQFNAIEKQESTARPCSELLAEFEKRQKEKEIKPEGVKLKFYGIELKDIYNITPPFFVKERLVIAARVENREDEIASEVHFFESTGDINWKKINITPLNLQDPFVVSIDDQIIVGGIEVFPPLPDSPNDSITYHTVFYKGENLDTLQIFAVGPEKMKDIRIIKLKNGRIGVFTRPQGGENNGGEIGYVEIDRLEDLNKPEIILGAKIIRDQFAAREWGGVNQLQELDGGRIGIVGHIACFDEKKMKHYYGMSFVFDPKANIASPIKIIATRENFPEGEAKKSGLEDVIFVGGIAQDASDKQWYLYAGLSDVESGRIPIEYPF